MSRPRYLAPRLLLILAFGMAGCTTTAPVRTPREDPPATVRPTSEPEMEAALAARDAAVAARERAEGSTAKDMLARAETTFEEAQTARFNSMWRAAQGLFREAEEYFLLALEIGGVTPAQETEIPDATPVVGASPQAVMALFDEVDQAQRLAYLQGGLAAAPEMVKEADALLWDAQIAEQHGETERAAGYLHRILGLYTEAYRLAGAAGAAAQEESAAAAGSGPVGWSDSYGAATRTARESGRPLLLFLYDRLDPGIAGLFADSEVCEAMASVVPAKHRVTDIVSGIDPVLLSQSDQEVKTLVDSYSLRTYPAILLLDMEGSYVDSLSGITERVAILELLEELP